MANAVYIALLSRWSLTYPVDDLDKMGVSSRWHCKSPASLEGSVCWYCNVIQNM